MKKTFTILLTIFISFSLFAETSEYRIKLSDKLDIGTSKSYECVATIAHLAEFPEYSSSWANLSAYDSYFKPYLSNKDVQAAIKTFKNLYQTTGFSYDAVASLGTYLKPDCNGYRTDIKTVEKNIESRCQNPKQLQKVVYAFYKATNFDSFYESQLSSYEENAQKFLEQKDSLVACLENLENYYNIQLNKVFISFSPLNGPNNYGIDFCDGKNTYFEPKFASAMFSEYLIVHELSHPVSNPFAFKVLENSEIYNYVNEQMQGERLEVMTQNAYGNNETFFSEMLNRANTIAIMQEFMPNNYWNVVMSGDKIAGFDEVADLVEILQLYKKGQYKNIDEFLPEFQSELIKYIHNGFPKMTSFPTELSPESTNSFTLDGKTYKAFYCGSQDVSDYSDYVCRNFFRIEDAYDDVKDFSKAGDLILYNDYPCPVKVGQVYRVEYLSKKGKVFVEYFRSDDGDFYEGIPITCCFWIE